MTSPVAMEAPPQSRSAKAYLALLTVYIIWGTTLGAIHIGIETIPPLLLACVRFVLAGAFILPICLLRGEAWPDWPSVYRHCIVGFFLFFLGHSGTYWALQHLPTGLGAALSATSPFWMLWLASVMPPKEKIRREAILGLVIGFIGMLILLSPKFAEPFTVSTLFWVGTGVILCNAFFWCVGAIYARKRPANSSLLMGVAIQNLFAGILLFPFCLVIPQHFQLQPSLHSLVALGYLVVIGTMIAMTCYLYILRHLSVPVVGTVSYVTPVITVLVGWLFLGEQLSWPLVLGTLVILTGVGLVQHAGLYLKSTEKGDDRNI